MNIRFSSHALRCRVSGDELDQLLAGRSISLAVPLPRNRMFRTSIRPSILGEWQLESDPTGVWLTIPRSDLEAFAASLPSKTGIEHRFATAKSTQMVVSFEVDVKKRSQASGDA